jgi:alkyl hydroperoxide reductase subunit AhpC
MASSFESLRESTAAGQIARVGERAPDFRLWCTAGGDKPPWRTSLSDYRGRWLALVFYPRDFSLVCPTELTAFSARATDFIERECEILGIGVDSLESHSRWIDMPKAEGGLGGLNFPLAADPDFVAAQAYGVYVPARRVALRGLFIIDPQGVLVYAVIHGLTVGRKTEEVLRVLDALQTGGLCAESWTLADPNIDATTVLGRGRVVSHYRILEKLGTGAFAAVFKAWDMTLERTVAIKVLKAAPGLAPEAVLGEARAAAALNHPNVCTVYAIDDSEGMPLIAMEYLSGRPLARIIERGALSADQAGHIARQIADAMATAHKAGIVHGDLKPANIVVSDEGVAKVLDFGLSGRYRTTVAPLADPEQTSSLGDAQKTGIQGTPSYMSPEQTHGERPSGASDVFAMGLILYEMLTGKRAITGSTVFEVFDRIREVQPAAFSRGLAAPFDALVERALERRPEDRRLTMEDFARALA